MSRWSEREIARKLAERGDELEPPAGLLEKIKSEIPPVIPVGTGVPEIDRKPSMPPRQRWLIAASVVTMIGVGLLVLHRTEVPSVEETARTAAGARQPAPREVIQPPPPAAPPRRSFAQPLEKAPEPKPVPQREEKQLKSLGYVSGPERDVQPEAPAGVVGGVAGGEQAGPPSVSAPSPAPPPPAAVQERADKKESTAGSLSRDEEQRRSNENLPRSAAPAPAPALQEAAKPQAAARAKAAVSEPGWQVPSSQPITLQTDAGTASYDVARRSIAEGKLPDPAAIRVGEILNAFDTGDVPRVEGAPTPFVQGPRYRLLRLHPFRSGRQAQLSFNPETVARYRLIGVGRSVLYEIELRPAASEDALVATLSMGGVDRTVALHELVPWAEASPGFRLAALAARFAEILKGSPGDLSEIARQAAEVGKELPNGGKAAELAEMAEGAGKIRGER